MLGINGIGKQLTLMLLTGLPAHKALESCLPWSVDEIEFGCARLHSTF